MAPTFDLAAWAKRSGAAPNRDEVILRPVAPSIALEASIRSAARSVVNGLQRETQQAVVPEIVGARVELARDSVSGLFGAFRRLRELLTRLVLAAEGMVERALTVDEARHRRQFMESVEAAVGVDLAGVIAASDVDAHIRLAVARSVNLIRGLGEDTAKKVEQVVLQALGEGASNREIAKRLTEVFGMQRRRAALIARDQAAKFNGNLNRIRQTQAGITEYVWATALDERVRGNPGGKYPSARPSHWAREGKRYRWDAPPEGGHPGEAIQCRCIGRPILRLSQQA